MPARNCGDTFRTRYRSSIPEFRHEFRLGPAPNPQSHDNSMTSAQEISKTNTIVSGRLRNAEVSLGDSLARRKMEKSRPSFEFSSLHPNHDRTTLKPTHATVDIIEHRKCVKYGGHSWDHACDSPLRPNISLHRLMHRLRRVVWHHAHFCPTLHTSSVGRQSVVEYNTTSASTKQTSCAGRVHACSRGHGGPRVAATFSARGATSGEQGFFSRTRPGSVNFGARCDFHLGASAAGPKRRTFTPFALPPSLYLW
jgi:hypothetical protein